MFVYYLIFLQPILNIYSLNLSLLKLLFPVLILPFFFSVFAQPASEGDRLISLSGIIIEKQSTRPLPYVNIYVLGQNRGTVSTLDGFFSIVVKSNDSLLFSSVGYNRRIFVVPDTLYRNRESIIVLMEADTIMLEEAVVYPWPTREQFREAFLSIEVKETEHPMRQYLEYAGINPNLVPVEVPISPIMNPISFVYENIVLKIKERMPKRKKASELPVFE